MRPFVLPIALAAACGGASLPPEAFGTFVETNSAAFDSKLDVGATGITLFVGVALPGARSAQPLACSAEAPGGIRRKMSVNLECAGEKIPYTFEYRAEQGDWLATEDGGTPQIFVRR